MELFCILFHYHVSFTAFSSLVSKYFYSKYKLFALWEQTLLRCIYVQTTVTLFTLFFTSAKMFLCFCVKQLFVSLFSIEQSVSDSGGVIVLCSLIHI